jgi:hypothetical protein
MKILRILMAEIKKIPIDRNLQTEKIPPLPPFQKGDLGGFYNTKL